MVPAKSESFESCIAPLGGAANWFEATRERGWVEGWHYAENQPCFKRPKGQMRLKLGGAKLSTGYIVLLHQAPSLLGWLLGANQTFHFFVTEYL